MRPIRLELEGFTSFREKTEVDFEGADLFVLVGPTGSGKSSLIDAMTFALYGSVPRYQDKSLIHPVISQGKLEARVRFDFSIGDTAYTAVRVVRRQKRKEQWGAVAKEVRLESGGEVLAGSAKELAREVKRLIGLDFPQFTTCVVLPQGEFARFLQETGAERQDLLKELLRLHVYDRMARAARSREAEAKTRGEVLGAKLDELGFATSEAKRAEAKHLRALEKLSKAVETAQADLTRLSAELQTHEKAAQQSTSAARTLAELALPRGIDLLGKQSQEASEELKQKSAAGVTAQAALDAAEAARAALESDPLVLRAQREAHLERVKQQARLEDATAEEAKATSVAESASQKQQAAGEDLDGARDEVAAIGRANAAHLLAAQLAAGEPCPVCRRELDEAPHHDDPPGLEAAQKRAERASAVKQKADAAAQSAAAALGAAKQKLRGVTDRIAELDASLEKAPSLDAVDAELASIAAADEKLTAARASLKKAQSEERQASKQLEELGVRVRAARNQFADARDQLAASRPATADPELWRPPPADDDDLLGSWQALLEWAAARRAELLAQAESASADASAAAVQQEEKLAELTAACERCEVRVRDHRHAEAVAAEMARSSSELERIEEAIERARVARSERAAAKKQAEVAGALARHLRANAFERWLLQEAFDELVSAGSARLFELSGGDYSFAADDKLDFQIVDHRNADETRSAKTLSGGETFLASLALALTLGEQVAGLAAEGAAALESMFLDEGFGTLDSDTLDTVASCIEDLGARGRMVGLVTHVRELAERVPVQFRVTRTASGSSVERVQR